MKVLVISEGLDLPEIHCLAGLRAAGIGVCVLLDPAARRYSELIEQGVEVIPLPLRSRIDPVAIWTIRRLLRTEKWDVVHCLRNNRPLSNFLLAAGTYRGRRVAYRGTSGHLGWWDPGSRMTYLHSSLDRIVCVSHAVRNYLLGLGLPERRLVTIYKGHDTAWYRGQPPANLVELGIPAGAFTVCLVANMRPVKGADLLVDALDDLPRDGSVHLLLVGEVRDERLRRLAAEPRNRGLVHLAGFRRDAPQLVGASQVVVMPSREREGLPRAVIEAMSQEVPAIVSDVGGMPELVESGRSGLVVPASNSRALAEAILRLKNNPEERLRMGRAARARIEGEFSVRRTIERTLALYRELLGE
jgi:glycosyltransferase involved in cell wall biosynthesis